MSIEPRWPDSKNAAGDEPPGGSSSVVPRGLHLSCDTFEREMFAARARTQSLETRCDELPLSSSQRVHLERCGECRREFEGGALSAPLAALSGLGGLGASSAGADPLFLPSVLAAVREERPPVRMRERRVRRQWLVGSVSALLVVVFVNVLSFPGNGFHRGEAALTDRSFAGVGASLRAASSVASGDADEYLLGYASQYLPCEFIPSGNSPLGDVTEIKF